MNNEQANKALVSAIGTWINTTASQASDLDSFWKMVALAGRFNKDKQALSNKGSQSK